MSHSQFKQLNDFEAMNRFFQLAKSGEHEVWAWRLIGASKLMVRVKLEVINRGKLEFAIAPENFDSQEVSYLIGGASEIDFYIPEQSLLFRSNLKHFETRFNRYYFSFPKFIALDERRHLDRLTLTEDQNLKVEFPWKVKGGNNGPIKLNKHCFDISHGGLSFLVSAGEVKNFKPSDYIPKAEFWIFDKKFEIDLRVSYIQEMDPKIYSTLLYKSWKVACKFNLISDQVRREIENYILEQIKKELHAINE